MIVLIVKIILIILAVSSVGVMVRTLQYRRRNPKRKAVQGIPVKSAEIAEHLASAIRCKTAPLDEKGTPDPKEFAKLHEFLQKTYPLVHKHLKLEKVGGFTLLYRWEGSKPKLQPVQLMAHQDVVSATLEGWTHPPFAGVIDGGFIWGRGALDIKNQLVGIMEGAEALLQSGFKPERTIYFAFGHDEETGGNNGAAKAGKLLKKRGVTLAGIVDEGGGIFAGIIPKIKEKTALIGVGEKGYLTAKITALGTGGHSSAPPKESAIGRLAHALASLEDNPMPAQIKTAKPLYWALGGAVPFAWQVAWANSWLFGPLLNKMMDQANETRAYIRTTTALTLCQAGTEDNTLPPEASAFVNFRMLPHDKSSDVLEHARSVINDKKVTVEPVAGKVNEAVGPSPVDAPIYRGLSRAIGLAYGTIPEAPFVMLGGTDCGHYVEVCQNIYRFTPLVMDPSFMGLEHGVNERIPIKEMVKTVKFYAHLMQAWGTEKMD